jgi:PAS domain S-box-containing protein
MVSLLNNKSTSQKKIISKRQIIIFIIVLLGITTFTFQNFLLYHGLVEIFGLIITCGVFMVVWNSRESFDNHYILFIGIAFLFVSIIELFHVLSYKGMNIFTFENESNPAIQLWIAARYLESLSFLLGFRFINRKLNHYIIYISFSIITVLILLSIFYWNIFPVCFSEGQGLTTFKIVSEYIISLIFLLSILLAYRNRKYFDMDVLKLFIIAFALTIIAELAFTFYISVYGLSNIVGHLFKILAYYMIYKSIVVTGITRPQSLLFYKLRDNQVKLESANKQLNKTLDQMIEGVSLIRVTDGIIVYTNPNFDKIFGYDFGDMLAKHLSIVYATNGSDSKSITNKLVDDTVQNGKWSGETRNIQKKGTHIWCHTNMVFFDHSIYGEVIISVHEDITLRKQSESELAEANYELKAHRVHLEDIVVKRTAELQNSLDSLELAKDQLVESEKMASLGSLVAGVAHEINTPVGIGVTASSHLEAITNDFSKSYKSGELSKGSLEEFIKSVNDVSVIILTNMVKAATLIQSFKQVAVDQTSEEMRTFNIKAYMNDILNSIHYEIKNTKHVINVDCTDNLVLNSYPGALSQAITNLISNSLVHGFANIDNGTISIHIVQIDNNLIIVYKDTGCGMSEDCIKRIYDPFFTTKRNQGGSGLGMNIVYNIISQVLKGTIKCTSKVNKGVTFYITLPVNM